MSVVNYAPTHAHSRLFWRKLVVCVQPCVSPSLASCRSPYYPRLMYPTQVAHWLCMCTERGHVGVNMCRCIVFDCDQCCVCSLSLIHLSQCWVAPLRHAYVHCSSSNFQLCWSSMPVVCVCHAGSIDSCGGGELWLL